MLLINFQPKRGKNIINQQCHHLRTKCWTMLACGGSRSCSLAPLRGVTISSHCNCISWRLHRTLSADAYVQLMGCLDMVALTVSCPAKQDRLVKIPSSYSYHSLLSSPKGSKVYILDFFLTLDQG